METNLDLDENKRLERVHLQDLIDVLKRRGYIVVGPTVRDSAIVYDELESVSDLPVGWTDEHGPGYYRIRRRDDAAVFGYVVGPHSWKRFLHPPAERLWRARRAEAGFTVEQEGDNQLPYAFLGVRACELKAIEIQDRVFVGGPYPDTQYAARRERALLIAVNCGQAGATCFCVSMKTGPKAESGYDIALTEIVDGETHYFVASAGTGRGAEILGDLPLSAASNDEAERAREVSEAAAAQMGRRLDTTDLKELLYRNFDHARWDDVARRCLTCANCTMVCPTCFCTTVEDVTDLTGENAERWKKWDSCFTMDHSYLHGGGARQSAKSRYRQWMTHKLATWVDQFGTSGCVGCGRCISWCPVGIDITEEVRAIRDTEPRAKE